MFQQNRLGWSNWSAPLLCLMAAVILAPAAEARRPLSIGVLYHEGRTGDRHLAGVEAAVSRHNGGPSEFKADIIPVAYLGNDDGIEKLRQMLKSGDVDLIIGPTDSDVLVKVDSYDELDAAKIPIVSPLVTSQIGNTLRDWRFRTNVDVEIRARTIYDYLNQRSHECVAVVYAKDEFGQRAEIAFRENLGRQQKDAYLAVGYADNDELREAAKKVLERRPSAVGVFGRRHEIKRLRDELVQLNSSPFAYTPLVFSIADARILQLEDVHFVSVMPPTALGADHSRSAEHDDVRGLAHDTTVLVLEQVVEAGDWTTAGWSDRFRKRFIGILGGPPQSRSDLVTGMRFDARLNVAESRVLTRTAAGFRHKGRPDPVLQAGAVSSWFQIRTRRYGWAPWLNIALVAVISGWLTVADIRNWRDGQSRSTGFRRPVVSLVVFNVATAIAVLVVAAEQGVVAWNSVFGALLVALAYRAMLKTTILETAEGHAFGFARLYEQRLDVIYKRLMVMKYATESAPINFIAYTNSLATLRSLLEGVYRFAKSQEESAELIKGLAAEIERAAEGLPQRRVCARRLLSALSWQQLQRERLVLQGVPEHRIVDPELILREAVDHILHVNPGKQLEVRRLLDSCLRQLELEQPDRYQAERDGLNTRLKSRPTARGRLYCRLEWLFIQYGFKLDQIKAQGLLPLSFQPPSRRQRARDWLRSLFRRLQPDERERPAAVEDRRRDPRVVMDGELELHVKREGQVDHTVRARCANIGLGGLALSVPTDVADQLGEDAGAVEVHVQDGPLANWTGNATMLDHHADDGGVRFNGCWSGLSGDAEDQLKLFAEGL